MQHSAKSNTTIPASSSSCPVQQTPEAHETHQQLGAQNRSLQAPAHIPHFDQFCFESEDGQSLILNYAGVLPLLQLHTCEQVLEHMVKSVREHMVRTKLPTFTLHLFCHGMKMRGMNQIKRFMLLFAQMFKQHFPVELQVCNVHHAPSFFASVYDLLRPILPKASRDKIVIVHPTSQQHS